MKLLFLAAALVAFPLQAIAQAEFVTPTPGQTVIGTVQMCLNSSRKAVPASSGTCASGGVSIPGAGSSAAETSHVFCSSACNVYALGFPACPSGYWTMLFDATSAPADGAVAPAWYAQSGSAGLSADWTTHPRPMAVGAVAVCSSTGPFTKTATSTEFTGQAQ